MIFRGKTPDLAQKQSISWYFHQKPFWKNCSFSKTIWNFMERFEDTRVKTSNMKFFMLSDHQVAHIYKYMGQNIPNILGYFGL